MAKSNLEASFNRLLLKQITTLYLSQFTIDAHIFLYLAEQANYNCHLHYYYHWNIFAILASCTRIELSSWFFKMKRMSHSRYTLLINWLIKKIIDNFREYAGGQSWNVRQTKWEQFGLLLFGSYFYIWFVFYASLPN